MASQHDTTKAIRVDNIPKKIREIRKVAGLTQGKISKRMGITRWQYLLYEKGRTRFPIKYLKNY